MHGLPRLLLETGSQDGFILGSDRVTHAASPADELAGSAMTEGRAWTRLSAVKMHEASIMESALESAAAEMRQAGARLILRVKLRVGVLSGVVPEALEFAFESLKGATPAAGAVLEIELMPAVFRCLDCEAESKLTEMAFNCPRCQGCLVLDHGGNELELTQLELN